RGGGAGDRPRRAERGVRVAEPGCDSRARPRSGEGERERGRDRDRSSARHERRAPRRDAAPRVAPARRSLRPRDAVRRRRAGPGRALPTLGALNSNGLAADTDVVQFLHPSSRAPARLTLLVGCFVTALCALLATVGADADWLAALGRDVAE